MGPVASIIVSLLLTAAIDAQPAVPTFADIPWGTPAGEVARAAASAGLRVMGQDADGDLELHGDLFDTPAIVYAFFSPTDGLVKVQVRLETGKTPPRETFRRVVSRLTERYGHAETFELYKAPYAKGDGQEDEAIRLGKGLLYSTWGSDEGPGRAAVVVRATRQVVGLDYESSAWATELERRRAAF